MNKNRDPLLHTTVYNILKNMGNIKISELAKSVNISKRQLRRKYNQWIGVSTKTFCRIIRFQSILQSAKAYSKKNLFPLALDIGFYDQSHFIHEFSSFYGLTPLEFAKIKKS
jgi:AraC-like DNA-binding protein